MGLGSIERQNEHYRRGLVLGFTLAEIITLIIFCLLLALTARLLKGKQEISVLVAQNEQQAAEINLLQAQLEEYKKAFKNPAQIDDLFRELVLLRQEAKQVAALKAQVQQLTEKADNWDRLQAALKDQLPPGATPEQVAERLLQDAEVAAAIREALEGAGQEPTPEAIKAVAEAIKESVAEAMKANPGLSPAEAIEQAVNSRSKLMTQIADLQGQNKNLRDKLERIGPGLEMPPCWADRDTGRPEFIFDVALLANGFIVRDRTPAHRQAQRAELWEELKLSVTFEQEIPSAQFLAEVLPLYNWSVKNQCRFFVQAFDLTGPDQKKEYKLMMRRLEMRFYKREVLNATF